MTLAILKLDVSNTERGALCAHSFVYVFGSLPAGHSLLFRPPVNCGCWLGSTECRDVQVTSRLSASLLLCCCAVVLWLVGVLWWPSGVPVRWYIMCIHQQIHNPPIVVRYCRPFSNLRPMKYFQIQHCCEETAVCFLHIQDIGTNVCSIRLTLISSLADLQQKMPPETTQVCNPVFCLPHTHTFCTFLRCVC